MYNNLLTQCHTKFCEDGRMFLFRSWYIRTGQHRIFSSFDRLHKTPACCRQAGTHRYIYLFMWFGDDYCFYYCNSIFFVFCTKVYYTDVIDVSDVSEIIHCTKQLVHILCGRLFVHSFNINWKFNILTFDLKNNNNNIN